MGTYLGIYKSMWFMTKPESWVLELILSHREVNSAKIIQVEKRNYLILTYSCECVVRLYNEL